MLELIHKKLIAGQKAILLLPLVYDCFKKLLPEEKYSTFSLQQWFGRRWPQNQKGQEPLFTTVRSSMVEVDNSLIACLILKFTEKERTASLVAALTEVFKLFSGLIGFNKQQERPHQKATRYSPLATRYSLPATF